MNMSRSFYYFIWLYKKQKTKGATQEPKEPLTCFHESSQKNWFSHKPGIRITPAGTLNPPSNSVVRHREIKWNWAQWHLGSWGGGGMNPPHTSNCSRTTTAHCVMMLSNLTHFLPLRSIQKLRTPLNASLVKIKTITRLC